MLKSPIKKQITDLINKNQSIYHVIENSFPEYNDISGNKIIKSYESNYDFIKGVYKDKNKGKGDSQKIAKQFVNGDYVIIQDADIEYEPEDINKLLKVAIDENKDFVIGFRKMKTSIKHPYFYFREMAVNALT